LPADFVQKSDFDRCSAPLMRAGPLCGVPVWEKYAEKPIKLVLPDRIELAIT
jgi:hypothetical protein